MKEANDDSSEAAAVGDREPKKKSRQKFQISKYKLAPKVVVCCCLAKYFCSTNVAGCEHEESSATHQFAKFAYKSGLPPGRNLRAIVGYRSKE